jgi:hypothetical protein
MKVRTKFIETAKRRKPKNSFLPKCFKVTPSTTGPSDQPLIKSKKKQIYR